MNDIARHAAGDRMLMEIARDLKEQVRKWMLWCVWVEMNLDYC